MKKMIRHLCFYLVFYAAALAACLAAMGLLTWFLAIPNWPMVGLGIWMIFCFASLCFPDELWERWMTDKL